MTHINQDFGIRDGGDRAAVLVAMHRNLGKPQPTAKLARLVRGKTTTRVARIVRRIEAKAKLYKLPYKVVRTDDAYALARK